VCISWTDKGFTVINMQGATMKKKISSGFGFRLIHVEMFEIYGEGLGR